MIYENEIACMNKSDKSTKEIRVKIDIKTAKSLEEYASKTNATVDEVVEDILDEFLEDTFPSNQVDPLFNDVIDFLKTQPFVSSPLLQRRFGVGYARSQRILQQLETNGYIFHDQKGIYKVNTDRYHQ